MKRGEKVLLCANFTYNCPSIEFDGQDVLVKDDHGNTCRIPPDGWNTLVEKVLAGELKQVDR